MAIDRNVVWTFYGYRTEAQRPAVQVWFDGLSDDEQDEAIDAMAYLQHLEAALWCKPRFFRFNDGLSEIRFDVPSMGKTIRIYGCFWPQGKRYSYTFLLGAEKKKKNPQNHIREARKRLKRLEKGICDVIEFDFEKSTDRQNSPG